MVRLGHSTLHCLVQYLTQQTPMLVQKLNRLFQVIQMSGANGLTWQQESYIKSISFSKLFHNWALKLLICATLGMVVLPGNWPDMKPMEADACRLAAELVD
ncbi:hypothetical protein BpHYR1_048148 [Brachionus plicatilis]|uniref:Uncharacterized protein n=1 Tax=Brachionus plicatilis TaxID=10195 RepID=A0A3M7T058_BRAPC|nr:hypothetical protein BpHYR1_048148 [Brachionus plicatilis]